MALVTVQRSPGSPNSPAESTGCPEEEESGETAISNVRECYIANRGTALVIGSTEIVPTLPSHDDVDGGNNQAYSSSHVNELNRQTDIEHEQCQTKCDISNNSGSEITHHLESMFNLLRPKETLKMAVKLESAYTGRTRYLVIVSRPAELNRLSGTPSHLYHHQDHHQEEQNYIDQPQHVESQEQSITQDVPIVTSIMNNMASTVSCIPKTTIPNTTASVYSSTTKLMSRSFTNIYQKSNQNQTESHHLDDQYQQIDDMTQSIPIDYTIQDKVNLVEPNGNSGILCDIDKIKNIDNSVGVLNENDSNVIKEKTESDGGVHKYFENNMINSNNDHQVTSDCSTSSDKKMENTNRNNFSRDSNNTYRINTNCNEPEESCLLGIDCNEKTTVGLVLRLLADTSIHLDGDGGFSVSVYGKTHIFKPVSVQAMWSAIQKLYFVSSKAREYNYYAGGPSHDWVSYYEKNIQSDRSCLNEWNAMDSIESRRPASPDALRLKPGDRDDTESVLRSTLKEIMMTVDLDEVTSKYIRQRLEEHLDMDLGEYKSFIDQEMLVILGQMDAPTQIFDHVYLGSEWNASNLEELQKNGVKYIVNVTREIDNFFPGIFDYQNIRVYDDEKTNLLKYWDDTFKYITRAKNCDSKVLVHCKMGVSRSASVVIAYAMKEYNWNLQRALDHVRAKRNCVKPNNGFISQLETYQGMLDAMKNKEKLTRSKSETNLKNVKDGRLLPGSEPTPLIQAFKKAAEKMEAQKSESETMTKKQHKKLEGNRPLSWSPSNDEADALIRTSKPQSQSLESLTPERLNDELRNTNVRLPCRNGQNYSVSPNQVFHLDENSKPVPFVKLIVNEFETNQRFSGNSNQTDDVWDPGDDQQRGRGTRNENSINIKLDVDDNDKTYLCDSSYWTSSAQIVLQTPTVHYQISETKDLAMHPIKSLANPDSVRNKLHVSDEPADIVPIIAINQPSNQQRESDLFSSRVDRVFDSEEKRQQLPSTESIPLVSMTVSDSSLVEPFVSRQSSWSSVDSAVVLGEQERETPSRQSSWGSGDNRLVPSRNSSCGSYDIFCSISSSSTNQLVAGTMNTKGLLDNFNSKGKFFFGKIDNSFHFGTVKRTKQKIEESTKTKRVCNDATKSSKRSDSKCQAKGNNRSNSEESLSATKRSLAISNRLSASAPESSIMNKVFMDKHQRSHHERPHSTRTGSMDDSSNKISKIDENSVKSPTLQTLSGKVQNLKKNFEAKAGEKTVVRSLPSSPIALHPAASIIEGEAAIRAKKEANEDGSVKEMVVKYEDTKLRPVTSSKQSGFHTKPRPRSVHDKSLYPNHKINFSDRLMITHNSPHLKLSEESRRPPVPPQQIRSFGNSHFMPLSGMAKSVCKKVVQQHGKTHPLSHLNLSQNHRFSTTSAAAYNTM